MRDSISVIPAKAEIQSEPETARTFTPFRWTPAFAGVTMEE
jgi:hypothetical protein